MFELLLASSLLFCGAQGIQGDDMDDDDFEAYLNFHTDTALKYADTAGKGCITGAIGGATGGFQGLCIGCGLGAAGNVAQDAVFPENKDFERVRAYEKYKYQ